MNVYRVAPMPPSRPPLHEVQRQHFYGQGPTWQDVLAMASELVAWKRRWAPEEVA